MGGRQSVSDSEDGGRMWIKVLLLTLAWTGPLGENCGGAEITGCRENEPFFLHAVSDLHMVRTVGLRAGGICIMTEWRETFMRGGRNLCEIAYLPAGAWVKFLVAPWGAWQEKGGWEVSFQGVQPLETFHCGAECRRGTSPHRGALC